MRRRSDFVISTRLPALERSLHTLAVDGRIVTAILLDGRERHAKGCDRDPPLWLLPDLGAVTSVAESFVPPDFEVPPTLEKPGFWLEPLGPEHNGRDHMAWMSSIDHIRSTPGFDAPDARWPTPMTVEQNLDDLVRHAADFAARRGFTYSILDGDDVIGCLYIYPSKAPGHDAEVSSWVTADRADLDVPVWRAVSEWLGRAWPFEDPEYAPRAIV